VVHPNILPFSEAYFYETANEQRKKFEQSLITGQYCLHTVINFLPLMDNNGKKIKMWHCNENKCHSDISMEKFVEFWNSSKEVL